MANVTDIIKRHGVLGSLIGINAAVFLCVGLSVLFSKFGAGISLAPYFALPDSFSAFLRCPWTLLSYMFTHIQPLHILFNMLWLAWFGGLLLELISPRKLLGLYLGGGLAGGLLYLCVASAFHFSGGMLMGASAAVLSIMAAAAVLMPNYTFHLFFIGDVKLKYIAIIMIVLAFIGLGGGNSGGEIAHLGGAAFGLVAAFIPGYLRGGKKTEREIKPKRVSRVISVMERHRKDAEELDRLLDKIRVSGYDSLTTQERRNLRELSQRIK